MPDNSQAITIRPIKKTRTHKSNTKAKVAKNKQRSKETTEREECKKYPEYIRGAKDTFRESFDLSMQDDVWRDLAEYPDGICPLLQQVIDLNVIEARRQVNLSPLFSILDKYVERYHGFAFHFMCDDLAEMGMQFSIKALTSAISLNNPNATASKGYSAIRVFVGHFLDGAGMLTTMYQKYRAFQYTEQAKVLVAKLNIRSMASKVAVTKDIIRSQALMLRMLHKTLEAAKDLADKTKDEKDIAEIAQTEQKIGGIYKKYMKSIGILERSRLKVMVVLGHMNPKDRKKIEGIIDKMFSLDYNFKVSISSEKSLKEILSVVSDTDSTEDLAYLRKDLTGRIDEKKLKARVSQENAIGLISGVISVISGIKNGIYTEHAISNDAFLFAGLHGVETAMSIRKIVKEIASYLRRNADVPQAMIKIYDAFYTDIFCLVENLLSYRSHSELLHKKLVLFKKNQQKLIQEIISPHKLLKSAVDLQETLIELLDFKGNIVTNMFKVAESIHPHNKYYAKSPESYVDFPEV